MSSEVTDNRILNIKHWPTYIEERCRHSSSVELLEATHIAIEAGGFLHQTNGDVQASQHSHGVSLELWGVDVVTTHTGKQVTGLGLRSKRLQIRIQN